MERPLEAWTVTLTSPVSGNRVRRLLSRDSWGWREEEEKEEEEKDIEEEEKMMMMMVMEAEEEMEDKEEEIGEVEDEEDQRNVTNIFKCNRYFFIREKI